MSLLSKVICGTKNPAVDLLGKSQTIVKTLGYLALAVVQAGAYIRETSCSLEAYPDLYDKRKSSVLQFLPTHRGSDYQHSVYTTWQVSVDMIASQEDAASRHAL